MMSNFLLNALLKNKCFIFWNRIFYNKNVLENLENKLQKYLI